MFSKKKEPEFKPVAKIEVKIPQKRELYEPLFNKIVEYSFTMQSPHDSTMISVVRVDDVLALMNELLERNEKKIEF